MQLPWLDPNAGRSPIGEGLGGIADTLMESRRLDQQRQQQMADTLLRKKQTEVEERRALAEEGRQKIAQQREDRAAEQDQQKGYAEALLAIKKHLTPGADYNPEYAAAIAEMHGIKGLSPAQGDGEQPPPPPMGQSPSPAMSAPPEPQGPPPPPFAMPPPGRIPSMQVPSQPPAGPPMGPDRSSVEPPPMSPGGGPPVSERDQHRMDNAGYAQQLAEHPQLVGEHAQAVEGFKAHRDTVGQTAGYPTFQATGPKGEALRFSTGSGQQSLQQERDEVTQRGLAAADAIEQQNPALKPMADKTRALAQYVKAGLMKPADFATHIEKLIGMDNSVSIAQGHDTTRLATAKLKKGAGGGAGGGYNLKTEKQNETELTHIESEKNKFLKGSGLDKQIIAYNELTKGLKELQGAQNSQSQIGVIDRMVRANTGGKATMQSIRLQLAHMGGLDAQLEGWLEGKTSGGLGEKQLATLKDAINRAQTSAREEINAQHETFVGSHFSGADYNDKGNWEKAHKDIFGQVRDEGGKELFPTQYDPNAPTIVRGTGRRSVDTVGVNAKAGAGSHPLVSAAKQGQLSPADQQKAVMARQRVQKNPDDAVAKEWLQAHGL